MYELIQVAANTFYVDCPAKMGIYRHSAQQVFLIDSGNDKEAAKKVIKILDSRGWTLSAVLNTHSNADHIGGNKLLLDRTGCSAYSSGLEAAFTQYPQLESSFLFGGFPPKPLRNKFLWAEAAPCMQLSQLTLPRGFDCFALPGHFFDMMGFKTPDDVYFMADCVSSPTILEKYPLTFIYDVAGYLKTLDWVETLEGALFIPAHTAPAKSMASLCALNRTQVLEILQLIKTLCRDGMELDALLAAVFDHYGLTLSFDQYVLVGSTVRSYLSYLLDKGHVESTFTQNHLIWRTVMCA